MSYYVEQSPNGLWCVMLINDETCIAAEVAYHIYSKDAAERIAAIYEEVMS